MVSVICPIFNEEKYIAKCIGSILAQDYPHDDLEVIFADGMSTDKTRDIVADFSAKFPWIKLIDNPKRIVPPALNAAIKEAKGDIIIRIDAHAEYPENYISSLVKALSKYNADNVGAVCKTDVLNKTPKSLAIKEVLAHPLGVGNSSFRTGIREATEVDTVPFGCWPKNVFNKFGSFDERLVRNQDIEFNKRILRNHGKIVIVPDTYSIYYARESFRKLAKNNYQNGKWNILTVWYTNQLSSLSLRHFIPLIFLLSILLPVIASIFLGYVIIIACISLIAYLLAVLSISIKLGYKKKINVFYLVTSFFILHISYGWGSLVGLLSLPFTKRK